MKKQLWLCALSMATIWGLNACASQERPMPEGPKGDCVCKKGPEGNKDGPAGCMNAPEGKDVLAGCMKRGCDGRGASDCKGSHEGMRGHGPRPHKVHSVDMSLLAESGNKSIGKIDIIETPFGLVFEPKLTGLSAGSHGFHIHESASCEPAEKDGKLVLGLAAGGHWDPDKTGRHGAPWEASAHKGDLPSLYVLNDGSASYPVLAPRLKKLDELYGRSLMIHVGGDNYSDHPQPLGGGGARMACGVISAPVLAGK